MAALVVPAPLHFAWPAAGVGTLHVQINSGDAVGQIVCDFPIGDGAGDVPGTGGLDQLVPGANGAIFLSQMQQTTATAGGAPVQVTGLATPMQSNGDRAGGVQITLQ